MSKPDQPSTSAAKTVPENNKKNDAPSCASNSKEDASPKRRALSLEDYANGVLSADPVILAQAITLVESNKEEHQQDAVELANLLLPNTGKSTRIGITGPPGAGKSTLIESFGTMLCELGHRVAVLAIDPSSSLSRGSILGDKTRMENLFRHPNSFIRPSPSGGTLGGVARKTRESILLCEAAGYDIILIETMGVGQSESAVRSMVDFFLLLGITGAGSELQCFKKGVIELADLIVINKVDGDNKAEGERMAAEFNRVLDYLLPATRGWSTRCLTCSALEGSGLADIWSTIESFLETTRKNDVFFERRIDQQLDWMETLLHEAIVSEFSSFPPVESLKVDLQSQVADGSLHVTEAVYRLLEAFRRNQALDPPQGL